MRITPLQAMARKAAPEQHAVRLVRRAGRSTMLPLNCASRLSPWVGDVQESSRTSGASDLVAQATRCSHRTRIARLLRLAAPVAVGRLGVVGMGVVDAVVVGQSAPGELAHQALGWTINGPALLGGIGLLFGSRCSRRAWLVLGPQRRPGRSGAAGSG